MELSWGAVFAAGIFSFFTPCVVPLVPVYSSLLFGDSRNIGWGMLNAVAFLLGFCLVFVAMGATVGALSDFFWEYSEIVRKVGALLMIFMGVYMLGVFKIDLLLQERRPLINKTFNGPVGSFMFGVAFTLGWTPCVGPILASVLAYAGTTATAAQGSILLLVYALGFCIPFLLLAVLAKTYMHKVRAIYKYLPFIQKISGICIIILGIALYFNLVKLLTFS